MYYLDEFIPARLHLIDFRDIQYAAIRCSKSNKWPKVPQAGTQRWEQINQKFAYNSLSHRDQIMQVQLLIVGSNMIISHQ